MSEPMAPLRWELPAVEGPIVTRRADIASDTKPLERTQFSRGHQAGLAAAKAEIQTELTTIRGKTAQIDAILQLLAQPLDHLQNEVLEQLSLLAITVAKHILRRELKSDPTQVIAIIRESISRLPATARDIKVQLHPDDAAVVQEHLAATSGDRAWNIVEDPTQSRGGCLIKTAVAQIDARLDSRINAIVSAVMGDERSDNRSAGNTS
jgi:flagellar assembly protein FliH